MKKLLPLLLVSALLLALTACGSTPISASAAPASSLPAAEDTPAAEAPAEEAPTAESQPAGQEEQAVTVIPHEENEMFTERDYEVGYSDYVTITLSGSTATADGEGVTIDGSTITITEKGRYLLTGTLSGGQIVVDIPDTEKAQLILDEAELSAEGTAPIYIKTADKVFITTASGTENRLSSTGEFQMIEDENVDGVIYSKEDLCMNGLGSLTIESETGHGIVTKDDLKITSGAYTITSAKKAIRGKDSVRIAGGDIILNAGTDGIYSDNEEADKGYVYIMGGTITGVCGNDGVDAFGPVTVLGGTFDLLTGGGADNAPARTDDFRGWDFQQVVEETTETEEDAASTSYKGIKSASHIAISGGSFTMDSADDAIHSDGTLEITGGSFTLSSGDDGIHSETELTISDGDVQITRSYEGIESTAITVSGGTIYTVAQDDAFNANNMGGSLTITGGDITVLSGGDSLDTNGTMAVSGGTIRVNGPENSGNGMLDYDFGAEITGGELIAVGAVGMNANFSATSTQCSILLNLTAQQAAGTTVSIADSTGTILAEYVTEKPYQCILISSPKLQVGETYTVTAGTETQTISLTTTIYGSGGGRGGKGGKGGMGRGF